MDNSLAKGGKKARNSSFELLRIVAMFAILLHHLVVHNVDAVEALPGAWSRLLAYTFAYPIGRVGVAIFIAITAWFYAEKRGSLVASIRKVWHINKQATFYSLLFGAFFLIRGNVQADTQTIVSMVLPIIGNTWWFVSTFSVFILILPFIIQGLEALGQKNHRTLCILLTVLYGVVPFIPYVSVMSESANLLSEFFVIVVMATYIRWNVYIEVLRGARAWFVASIVISLLVLVFCYVLSQKQYPLISSLSSSFYSAVFSHPSSILSLTIAIPSLLLAASTRVWTSKPINVIASFAFGTYLITDYALMRPLIWSGPLSLSHLGTFSPSFLACCVAAMCIFLVACAIDAIRAILFSLTVDRHPAKYLNMVIDKCIVGKKINA